jgi:hypothetical protein
MSKTPKEIFYSYRIDPAMDEQRWRDDKIAELPEGYTLRPLGKAFALFYRRGAKIIEFPAEISGTPEFDIIIFVPERGLAWIDATTYERTHLAATEMQAELDRLRAWLESRGMRPSM